MELASRGERVEFEEYAAERIPALVRTATALSRDAGLAEDMVQEVLIKVGRRWEQIGAMGARDSYVHRMLVNEFLSWKRKWARIIPTAEIRLIEAGADHTLASADRQLLDEHLSHLPKRQQVVLALRYYEGMGDEQIAGLLDCKVGTVRSLASRALSALRIDPVLRTEFNIALATPEKGHLR